AAYLVAERDRLAPPVVESRLRRNFRAQTDAYLDQEIKRESPTLERKKDGCAGEKPPPARTRGKHQRDQQREPIGVHERADFGDEHALLTWRGLDAQRRHECQ